MLNSTLPTQISVEKLSIEALIAYAHKSATQQVKHPSFYEKVNKLIVQHITTLMEFNVRMIKDPNDAPYQILKNTIKEQQREKALLLANKHVSVENREALRKADPEAALNAHSLERVTALDMYINGINIGLEAYHLPRISQNIKEIFLNHGLTRLPPKLIQNLCDYPALTGLSIANNHLTTLPDAIANLKNITFLDLRGNKLRLLTANIEKLTALTELYLDDNQLTTLPESMANLKSLKVLKLEGNHFKFLPKSLRPLLEGTSNQKYFELLQSSPKSIPPLKIVTDPSNSCPSTAPTSSPTFTAAFNRLKISPKSSSSLTLTVKPTLKIRRASCPNS